MVTFDARDPGTTSAEWERDPRFASVPAFSLTGVEWMIVLAAHPDDETLGAGALIAAAGSRGIPTDVIIVTDGGASHPASPTARPADLVAARAAEAREAVVRLNPDASLTLLGFPDGRVLDDAPAIRAALAAHLAAPPADRRATGGAAPAATRAAVPAATGGAVPGAIGEAVAGATRAADGAGTARTGRVLLVAPWRGDEHPDHRGLGEIAATLANERGPGHERGRGLDFELVEYPLWLWLWSTHVDPATPWASFVALEDPDATARKHHALGAYPSQTDPLSSAPGDEALLNPTFLQNFYRNREIYIVHEHPERIGADYFAETYARTDDPWGFTSRWYEERKRSLTLAALPRARFERTLEIGCSIGVLTEQLAPRTRTLLAVDIAQAAVDRALHRLAEAGLADVRVAVADVAERFPEGPFDLILLSEVGYYFDESTLRRVLADADATLTDDGVFVACHWRHPVTDYLQSGDGVHRVLAEFAATSTPAAAVPAAAASPSPRWTLTAHHLERDFVLDVYSRDPRSVAERTGLA